MRATIRRLLWPTALVVLITAAGGCIFSPDNSNNNGGGGGQPQYPEATTPDQLMENFKNCYDAMDYSTYADKILHPEFKFVFAADTPEAIAGPTGYLDHDQELQTTQNMFEGHTGTDPVTGQVKDPVQDVQFTSLIKSATDWEAVPSNDPYFPDSLKALYDVDISFVLEGGLNQFRVQSQQLFFVKAVQVQQSDGTLKDIYKLIGQQDFDSGAR